MYEIVELYTTTEVAFLRQAIENHVGDVLGLSSLTLKNYHLEVSEDQHKTLSDKRLRVFRECESKQIESLAGTRGLMANHPGYEISNVIHNSSEREARPQFYFRLVRPGHPDDVGLPHCDFWFDAAMGTGWGKGNTIKFWIPIEIEPGLNGLYFFPSAPPDVPFKILESGGFRRPQIATTLDSLGTPVLPCPAPGQALKFGDDVLHAGAPNRGTSTRVSIEITLVRGPM